MENSNRYAFLAFIEHVSLNYCTRAGNYHFRRVAITRLALSKVLSRSSWIEFSLSSYCHTAASAHSHFNFVYVTLR